MFPMAKASTRWLHMLVLLSLIGGLLLGACGGGELNVDLNLDGGESGDGGGSGALSESNLFILLIVVFVVIAAVAMLSGR
jgi:hypothetical protein